jgi:hypothetical protein
MRRYLLAVVAVVAGNALVYAFLARPPQPAQLAATAEVVLTGTVTAVEKDLVEVPAPYAGAKEKQKYRVAVVKVEAALAGIDGAKVKEVKVGVFEPVPVPPRAVRPPGGPAPRVELKEGQEVLLFLNKHPHADFYLMTGFGPPADPTTAEGKRQLGEVKKVAAILADPVKALKSDKAGAPGEAAAVLVTRYRAAPPFVRDTEQVAIGADESKLVLHALAEGEWKAGRFDAGPNAFTAFNSLGLTEKDGWIQPVIVAVPGQPAPDYAAVMKDAFTKWLAGPGKDYRIKRLVPKK